MMNQELASPVIEWRDPSECTRSELTLFPDDIVNGGPNQKGRKGRKEYMSAIEILFYRAPQYITTYEESEST